MEELTRCSQRAQTPPNLLHCLGDCGCIVGEKSGGALCRVKIHRSRPHLRYVGNGKYSYIHIWFWINMKNDHVWRVTSCPCLPCLVDVRYRTWVSPHRRHFWRVTSCPCLPCLVDIRYVSYLLTDRTHDKTRRSLGGAHVPPTKVFRQLTGSVNKTIVKPLVAAAVGRKTILKPRVAAVANT